MGGKGREGGRSRVCHLEVIRRGADAAVVEVQDGH